MWQSGNEGGRVATVPSINRHRVGTHAHRGFRVMGSAANITLVAHDISPSLLDGLLDRAEHRLRDLEALWSRFLPASDVTRANQAAGNPVTVHPDTIAVVGRAIEAWKQTRGRFDPTVLPALTRHGDTMSRIGPEPLGTMRTSHSHAPSFSGERIGMSGSITIDHNRHLLTVPAGTAIDVGGIGKGFAADLVATEMIQAGVTGVMVDVGGDVAVRGMPASGERWLVGVQDPTDPFHLIASVALVLGGLATSATSTRRWRAPSGETAHHLIDPGTGAPSTTTLLSATVIAPDAATAEAFSTSAMMHDGSSAIALLDEACLAGLLVTRDATVLRTRSMRAFMPAL